MPHQYVKAGPSSKVASQVRHITLNEEVLDCMNGFIDALLVAIIQEASPQDPIQEVSLSSSSTSSSNFPHLRHVEQDTFLIPYPIKTEAFKEACFILYGKHNRIIKKAVLEADFIHCEWVKARGPQSDHAISLESTVKEDGVPRRDGKLLAVPATPFSKRKWNRSTSTLQSIKDVGEDGEGRAEEEADTPEAPPAAARQLQVLSQQGQVNKHTYIAELQKALVLVSPLADDNAASHSHFHVRSRRAREIQRNGKLSYVTPLLALYASSFVTHIAEEIIKGVADLVEMNPKMSSAAMSVLEEYIQGNDDIVTIWMSLQLPAGRRTPKFLTSTQADSLQLPNQVSKSDTYLPLASLPPDLKTPSTSSSSLASTLKPVPKRLSINAELASAHCEIINLSRASPIERVAAESIRRRSWGEVEVGPSSLQAAVMPQQREEGGQGDDSGDRSVRKMDGVLPVLSTPAGQEELITTEELGDVSAPVTVSDDPSSFDIAEKKDGSVQNQRPDSSLSVISIGGSSNRPYAFTNMFRRASIRDDNRKDDGEGEKEVASELNSQRRRSRDITLKPGKRSGSRISTYSRRSSSSMSNVNSRNVISKGNRSLTLAREIGGSQADMRNSNEELEAVDAGVNGARASESGGKYHGQSVDIQKRKRHCDKEWHDNGVPK